MPFNPATSSIASSLTPLLGRLLDRYRQPATQNNTLVTNNNISSPLLDSLRNSNTINLGQIEPVTPVPEPVQQTYIPQQIPQYQSPVNTGLASLGSERDRIQAELSEIEARLSGTAGERQTMLEERGVFDDVRRLNELRSELRAAEDRGIEIPLEARRDLRGTGATIREFENRITAPTEDNLLRQLSASRAVSSQTDIINTNLAVVDSYFAERNRADEFAFQQKQARLNNIEQAYSSIITSQQATALEERKFQNQVQLEQMKFENDLFKGALDKAVEQGIDMAAISRVLQTGGGLADLYSLSANYLPGDQNARNSINANLMSNVDLINGLLSNEQGLKNSVGTTWLGRTVAGQNILNPLGGIVGGVGRDLATGETTKFRNDLKYLAAQETLRSFLELKNQGATFGAMSEGEWAIVERAALNLGSLGDGRSNLSEKDFTQALETVQKGIMKTYIRNNMTASQYASSGLADINTNIAKVKEAYNALRQPTSSTSTGVDYASQDISSALAPTFNLLQQEEGFRTQAYRDGGGYSIGFGTQNVGGQPVKAGQTITPQQAAQETVNQVIQNYTNFATKLRNQLTPNQFAALTSFEYNLGSGVWNDSTGQRILALIDSGQYQQAGQLMQQYNKSQGQVLPVLQQRRAREAQLLLA